MSGNSKPGRRSSRLALHSAIRKIRGNIQIRRKIQLLTFLAAGHETTSSALTWATYLLSLHPSVQDRLRKEVHEHIHSLGPGENVTSEVIESMPFLNAVCNETLRLFPTVPVTVRQSIRPTTILEQAVPKGTEIIICPWATNRLPSLWGADAEEFVPDRWMADGQASLGGASSYSLITFLHGPRSCIGQGFAKAELKCLLAAMVGRFEMQLAKPKEVPIPAGVITIKPQNGMHLRLKELQC